MAGTVTVEIHGWTIRSDGTLWFGVQVVDGIPPALTADLPGTRFTMTEIPDFPSHSD